MTKDGNKGTHGMKTEPHTIKTETATIVFNGGEPLDGCPPENESGWEWAKKWEDAANIESDGEGPQWKFDCGFKLDYDGPAVQIDGRFYPPKAGYGPGWDGTVSLRVGDNLILERTFQLYTIEELRTHVEAYVRALTKRVGETIESALHDGELDGILSGNDAKKKEA